MKLHELGAQRQTEQISKALAQRLGDEISFDRLRENQARRMLSRVQNLLREYRSSPSRHFSERNPDYLRLMMLEQALSVRVKEQAPEAGAAMSSAGSTATQAAMRDPKSKAVMDKVQRGQSLTPDEQKTVNKIALAKEGQVNEKYQGFEKTVKAIKKGGSARDPEAVAAIRSRLEQFRGDKHLGRIREMAGIQEDKTGAALNLLAAIRSRLEQFRGDKHLGREMANIAEKLNMSVDEFEEFMDFYEYGSDPEEAAQQLVQHLRGVDPRSISVTDRDFDEEDSDELRRIREMAGIQEDKTGAALNLLAAIGRKKYGKERFQRAAAAGRKLGESRLRSLLEGEIQTAQVVLAAQDMIDRIQKMMEDISEMQFKDLPALTDSIKNDMGVEQSQQFQQQAATALTTLLQAVQAGKTELEAAQGVLTGQAPVVPGADDAAMGTGLPAAGDLEADMNTGEELPPMGDEEEDEEIAAVSLGRERR